MSSYTLPVVVPTPGPSTVVVGVDPVEITSTSSHALTVDPVRVKPTTSHPLTVDPVQPQPTDKPTEEGSGNKGPAEQAKEAVKDLWDWFTDKVEEIWDKITGSR